jgi:hypothetical protein
MSDPEIDRRCNVCGASVRPRAGFCPQCGQPISSLEKAADTQFDHGETKAIVNTNETVPLTRERLPDLSETQPLVAVPAAVAPPKTPEPKGPRANDGRARGRVDKLRKASSVVIDQAAYDPSLRFVLVAAGLFLLSLFLLLLSKVLG